MGWCLERTGFYNKEVEEEDDPFGGEALSGSQELVTAMEVSWAAEEVLAAEDKIEILKYALVSLTQQIQNGEKRQEKKFWRIMRAFLRNQH